MPAETVHARSSAASTQPALSSPFPNTNPEPKAPFDFSAFNWENREDVSSSNGVSASKFVPNGAFATPNPTRVGSAAPGMSRPRLVKVRRRVGAQQVRSNLASETCLSFNPFRSVSASSDGVSNGSGVFNGFLDASGRVISGPSTSGGLDFSNIDVNFGKVEKNTNFVFSAKQDDSAANLNLGESDSGTADLGKFNIQKGSESNKFENVGFMFDAKQDDKKLDSGQSCTNGGEYLFNDKEKVKIESECDCGKFGSWGLVFGIGADASLAAGESSKSAVKSSFAFDHQNGLASNLNSDMGKASASLEKPISNGADKFEMGPETVIGVPNMETREYNESTGKPGYGNMDKRDKDEFRNCDDHSFVFGASWSKSVPNSNLEEEESSENTKQSVFNHRGKAVAGSSNGTFVFESSSSKNSIFHGNDSKNSGKMKDSNLDSAAYKANSFAFQSSGNGAGASSLNPQFTLPDEMKKLNINNCGNIDDSENLGEPSTEFKTPMWDPSSFKANIFPEVSKKLEFSAKSRSVKDKRFKKKKGKLWQPSLAEHSGRQNHVHHESGSQENSDSAVCYSPMDFSPYQEITAADQCAEQVPMTSNEPSNIDMKSLKCRPSVSDTGAAVLHSGRTVSGAGITSTNPVMGEFCSTTGVNSASARDLDGSCSYAKGQESDGRKLFTFASGLDNVDDKKFSFCASSSLQSISPATNRRLRKKNPKKLGCDPFVITPSSNVKLGSSSLPFSTQAYGSLHFDTSQGQQGNVYASQDKGDNKCEVNEHVKKGSVSSNTTIQELCEKWRLRGNQAYKNGHLPKAEEYYTQGVNSVPISERSGSCLKPLVLCYSNRAATRMSLGRIREALGDCTVAAALDPNFLKVQTRAANCHLLLGEVDNALQCFNKCVESGGHVCLDRRLLVEAADGLQKAQKVAKGTKSSAKLLEQRTPDAALSALEIIVESLLISTHSEELLKMKAEALSVLRRNEEVIQLCEQTISFAEENFSANTDGSLMKPWRWFLISKSYFYMGRLETALERLEKLEQSGSTSDKCNILESSMSLGVTIRELLRHKNDGNEAFRSGRYLEAVEHYTVALSSNVESRPFSAVCFCNRAAAHQALGQSTDAIADCSLSLALDPNYAKAVSRRATLHEMIRDYGQAASDLQRLVSILANQSAEKSKSLGAGSRSSGDAKELRQAHRRMSLMEEEAKKGTPLNLYLILGIKQSDSASDIKKAYHKAALRHHPDKAGQFLAKSESGDEGQLWKEIAQEVYKDADKLFKMIGEAYAVLSDPSKRSEYDLEEELRNLRKKGNGSGTSTFRKASEAYSKYPFERSTNRQNWQETWKTYGSSHSRW